jgi:thiopurine S-methyltransferase
MSTVKQTKEEQAYWSTRYEAGQTGWDIGAPAPALQAYFEQIADKKVRILIPGAGNAYEAEYLWKNGFEHTTVLDIAAMPLKAFAIRNPDFPLHQLVQDNFFEHRGEYDLIIEQTFFCSFVPTPENRQLYAQKMAALLPRGGKLVGLWFDIPLTGDMDKRPFGGTKEEYLTYFTPYFDIKTFEKCYNSIKPREGNEFFGILIKK